MKNAMEIRDTELDRVNGGTFGPNMFTVQEYNEFGIKARLHFFGKDEFTLPDGSDTDAKGANAYIKAHFPKEFEDKSGSRKTTQMYIKSLLEYCRHSN